MSNSLNCTNQQIPCYSGITINITAPAAAFPPPPNVQHKSGEVYAVTNPSAQSPAYINRGEYLEPIHNSYSSSKSEGIAQVENGKESLQNTDSKVYSPNYPQVYPQYYVNNYDYSQNNEKNTNNSSYSNNADSVKTDSENYSNSGSNVQTNSEKHSQNPVSQAQNAAAAYYSTQNGIIQKQNPANNSTSVQNVKYNSEENSRFAPNTTTSSETTGNTLSENSNEENINTDTSKEIIKELDEKNAEQKELEKNGKKTKVVSLTNEYIMSLENYLNNPNTDIRLMASKEILTRLDEDKSRYDDAALNALLNKMLQDPNKLIRIAAMSAFSSELASGNEYTVQLLNQIQQNPNSDPEDVLEASQILLKRSTSTEVRYIPVVKQEQKVEEQQQ